MNTTITKYICYQNVTLSIKIDKKLLKTKDVQIFLACVSDILKILLTFRPFRKRKISNIEIDLEFLNLKQMQKLNTRTRNIHKATDVLSFPVHDDLRIWGKELIPNSPINLGSIVICLTYATDLAISYGKNVNTNLTKIFIHGLLHLLGYDHELSVAEYRIMNKLEKAFFKAVSKGKELK